MKLYFMKESALEYLKVNMATVYVNYYRCETNDWIYDLFDYDPFEFFREVPDFELASLSGGAGEIDFENCKRLYSGMSSISESQAADERLWAGLCNGLWYGYMRKRWHYDTALMKEEEGDVNQILLRFFYKTAGRSGMFRNSLSKLWWVGRLTYSPGRANQWELLDAIGQDDLVSKISDIFYSYTFSGNREILEGICRALQFFRSREIYISVRDHLRPTMQYLNALGGGVLLDMFTADEIRDMVIEKMGQLIREGNSSDPESNEGEGGSGEAESEPSSDSVPSDSAFPAMSQCSASAGSGIAEQSDRELNADAILGIPRAVCTGTKATLWVSPDEKPFESVLPFISGKLNFLQKKLLGKKPGEAVCISGKTYTVQAIHRM